MKQAIGRRSARSVRMNEPLKVKKGSLLLIEANVSIPVKAKANRTGSKLKNGKK